MKYLLLLLITFNSYASDISSLSLKVKNKELEMENTLLKKELEELKSIKTIEDKKKVTLNTLKKQHKKRKKSKGLITHSYCKNFFTCKTKLITKWLNCKKQKSSYKRSVFENKKETTIEESINFNEKKCTYPEWNKSCIELCPLR